MHPGGAGCEGVARPELAPSTSQQFTATVTGIANSAVSWTVDGKAGGSTTAGTITSSGLYTAPGAGGNHTIGAISAADPTKVAQAAVTVTGPKLVLLEI